MKPDLDLPLPTLEDLGRTHFLGIGGAGMSGLARIMLARGVAVSGSDAKDSTTLAELADLGARVFVGHDADQVDGAATVVVSTAVRETNPELIRARELGLRVLHRSQALAVLMAGRRALAVAGTHGKTTTTSMAAVALRAAGADPSYAIGGELTDGGSNAHAGGGIVFVAEADESDGSFLLYRPEVAVITNVEADHLDHYGTAEAVSAAFAAFAARVVEGGVLVWCADDAGARAVLDGVRPALLARGVRTVGYGTDPAADVRIVDLDLTGPGARFGLIDTRSDLATDGPDGGPGAVTAVPLTLRVPGAHNARNAAAAYAAATALGAPADGVLAGLAGFGGARRRFEAKGSGGGVAVYDDYAHHPTEVEAVLRAARGVAGAGRVIAVFQPHLYSRTRIFAAEFAAALGLADEVVVLEVYGAREDPEPGVTGALIADRVAPVGGGAAVFAPTAPDAVAAVLERARPGDLVLTVGAGDVTELGPLLRRRLEEAPGPARSGS